MPERSAALLIDEFGELDVQRHTMRCLWPMDQGKVRMPPSWLTASMRGDWSAPRGMPSERPPMVLGFRADKNTFAEFVREVRTLEDLLPMVDQIAGVISQGNPARQRQVLSALFERAEVLDGKITRAKLRDWARPLFNGETRHQ